MIRTLRCYKTCSVPLCDSTSIATPHKLFFHVPNKKTTRDEWFKRARRNPADLSSVTSKYFCEDHFDLPNDMENYMQYRVMGSVSHVRARPGCVPTKFDCQPDRNDCADQPYLLKKRKKTTERFEEIYIPSDHLEDTSQIMDTSDQQLLMQLNTTNQEEPVIIKTNSKNTNECNANNTPMSVMSTPFTIKQEVEELINTQKSMDEKFTKLQQYLQSLKTEMTTLEKDFENEKVKFQFKFSIAKDTYDFIELALTNMDTKANVEKITDKPPQSRKDLEQENLHEQIVNQNILACNNNREVKCEMSKIVNKDHTYYARSPDIENSVHRACDIKVEPETILYQSKI